MIEKKDFFNIRNNFKNIQNVESVLLHGAREESPLFSIMIPTYLRNIYLKDTINSALKQVTEIQYEIVIVDNNPDFSCCDTYEVVKDFCDQRLVYYKNRENLGMFGNWNRCLELANAKWVLILHDDDTISEDYISSMWKIIKKNEKLAAVGCNYRTMDGEKKLYYLAMKEKLKRVFSRETYRVLGSDFYFIHPINIMGALLNKEKAISIGGFDNRWNPISDYVFLLCLADKYNVYSTQKTLLNYRIAVNASLTPKHLIGMYEYDILLRKFLGEKFDFYGISRDLKFRNCLANIQRNGFQNGWIKKLSKEEQDKVIRVYDQTDVDATFVQYDSRTLRIVKFKQFVYRMWIRMFRQVRL